MTRRNWLHTVPVTTLAVALGLALVGPASAGESGTGVYASHLLCYKTKDKTLAKGTVVDLTSKRLGKLKNCQVKKAKEFCEPVAKQVVTLAPTLEQGQVEGGSGQRDLICYNIKCDKITPVDRELLDQFGARHATVKKTFKLCLPAIETPDCLSASRKFVDFCGDLSAPGSEAACNNAWALLGDLGTPTACFFGPDAWGSSSCHFCDAQNAAAGLCSNVCSVSTVPTCLDGTRTFNAACTNIGDQTSCQAAWQVSEATGEATSCFYGPDVYSYDGCHECDPTNDAGGKCDNVCSASPAPSCLDASRSWVTSCGNYGSDPTICNSAWQVDYDTRKGDSCFHDGAGSCLTCDAFNELGGRCTNACSAPPPSCAAGSRTYTPWCGDFHFNESACNGAWEFDPTGPASCFYGVNRNNQLGCWNCDPQNARWAFCPNVCAAP